MIEKYCNARQIGATNEIAAGYAGISQSVTDKWIRSGKVIRFYLEEGRIPELDDISDFDATTDIEWLKSRIEAGGGELPPKDRIFLQFLNQSEKADTNAAISWLQVIDKAASIDPTWAMKLLRLRYPKGYTEAQQVELSGPNGAPLTVKIKKDFSEFDNEQLLHYAEHLTAAITAIRSLDGRDDHEPVPPNSGG